MARHSGSQRRTPFVLLAATLGVLAARTVAFPSGGDVRWVPLEEAATAARQTGRPILYAFTERWSAGSDLLEAQVFSGRGAGLVNAGFVPVRVPDRWERDAGGAAGLRARYEVDEVPMLVVARHDGTLLRRWRRSGSVETAWRGRQGLEQFLRSAPDAAAAAGAPE